MIKNAFILLNIFFTLILNVIFGEGVKVSQNVPDKAKPGSEFEVSITINKTDVSGFAKIQQVLPEGFTATAIETQGASFTYNDNKVKLIWMALPENDEFLIKYKVSVDNSVSGEFEIGGKFSYLYNNERQVVDMPLSKISISNEEEEEEEKQEEPLAEESTPQTEAVVEASANANRTITKDGDGYRVDISIEKSNIEGFAKIQETLPEGTTNAEQISTDGAVFTFVSGKAKFVWMSVPEKEKINVSYKLFGPSPSELENITGNFSYLANEETRKASISTTNIDVPEEEPVAETIEPEEKEEPIEEEVTEEPIAIDNTPKKVEDKKEEKTENIVEETNNVTASVPAPQTGIVYKVQICAGHEQVKIAPHFKSEYKFDEEPISLENHEGWLKYTIGGYKTYASARDRREEVTSGYNFPGPFVTAYNSGQRITVQEALMISNQKWIK